MIQQGRPFSFVSTFLHSDIWKQTNQWISHCWPIYIQPVFQVSTYHRAGIEVKYLIGRLIDILNKLWNKWKKTTLLNHLVSNLAAICSRFHPLFSLTCISQPCSSRYSTISLLPYLNIKDFRNPPKSLEKKSSKFGQSFKRNTNLVLWSI